MGGAQAWAVLDGRCGVVLAVFARSLYLENAAGVCCVGSAPLPHGPLNLVLPDAVAVRRMLQRAAAGMGWRFDGMTLALGGGQGVVLTGRRLWQAPRSAGPQVRGSWQALSSMEAENGSQPKRETVSDVMEWKLAAGCEALRGWLRDVAAARGGVESERGDPGLRCAASRLRRTHGQSEVPERVLALVGCGHGLTPSGDDVLVGALIALHAMGQGAAAERLADALRDGLAQRTGRVSAAHLRAACDGEAVAPVHAVVNAVLGECPAELARAQATLEGHGHRSGRDALRGIRLVMDVVTADR